LFSVIVIALVTVLYQDQDLENSVLRIEVPWDQDTNVDNFRPGRCCYHTECCNCSMCRWRRVGKRSATRRQTQEAKTQSET